MSGNFTINTEKEWRKAVTQAAGVVLEEVEEAVKDGGDFDDALAEALDSRAEAWTTYYADTRGIIKWTDNIDAVLDVGYDIEISSQGGSVLDALQQIAYWAFRQDVTDALDEDALEALRDYDEDDDEPQRSSTRRSMQRSSQPLPRKTKNPRRIRRLKGESVIRRFLKGS